MAVKRKSKKPVETKRKPKKVRKYFFRNEKFKFIFGVLIMLLAAYLLVAFVSFLFFGAADQSKLDLKWSELVFNPEIKVENKAGKTGAFLSEIIINKGFGIASFAFIYLMIIVGLRTLGRKKVNFGNAFVYSLILLVWVSVTLGLIFNSPKPGSAIYWGGHYGFVLSDWLNSMIGTVGLVLLLFIIGLALLVVRFENSLPAIKNLFKAQPRRTKEEEDMDFEEELSFESPISKVIEEGDVVKAIFDPDDVNSDIIDNDFVIDREEVDEPEYETKDQLEKAAMKLIVRPKVQEEEGDEDFEAEGMEDYDPTLDLSSFKFPTLDLLEDHKSGNAEVTNDELIANKNKIVETLRHYKIEITKIRATIGPTITLYEIVPAPGIRISKIKNLEDDIALSLSALGIRIVAPIPGRGTIGIEVPNLNPEVVSMRSIVGSKKFQESNADLPIALGKTISNETYMFDLAKMPHILVAGATGQGKSVGVNVIITSLIYKKHPSQLKFVFIDPKKVELNLYSVIEKHYLAKLPDEEEPVITDIQKVKRTLNSLNVEMDGRYDLLKKAHARNVKEYNKKFVTRKLNPNKGHKYMPYIVVIIDEFADLIMTAGKEIELPIARIAQLARAVGIHMIIATQRPSVTIITGVIKANFPARIAYKGCPCAMCFCRYPRSGKNLRVYRRATRLPNGIYAA